MPDTAPTPHGPEGQPPSSVQRLYNYAKGLFPDPSPIDSQSVTRHFDGVPDNKITFTRHPQTDGYDIAIVIVGETEQDSAFHWLHVTRAQLKNLGDFEDTGKDRGPKYQESVASHILNNLLRDTTDEPKEDKQQIGFALRSLWRARLRRKDDI